MHKMVDQFVQSNPASKLMRLILKDAGGLTDTDRLDQPAPQMNRHERRKQAAISRTKGKR